MVAFLGISLGKFVTFVHMKLWVLSAILQLLSDFEAKTPRTNTNVAMVTTFLMISSTSCYI